MHSADSDDVTHTLDDLNEAGVSALAQRFAAALQPGDVVVLTGELGAGKSLFCREAIYALGVPRDVAVSSPTFTLVQTYDARVVVAHLDLYRLSTEDELFDLGIEELCEQGVLLVEWGERSPWLMESATHHVAIEVVSDDARRVTVAQRASKQRARN